MCEYRYRQGGASIGCQIHGGCELSIVGSGKQTWVLPSVRVVCVFLRVEPSLQPPNLYFSPWLRKCFSKTDFLNTVSHHLSGFYTIQPKNPENSLTVMSQVQGHCASWDGSFHTWHQETSESLSHSIIQARSGEIEETFSGDCGISMLHPNVSSKPGPRVLCSLRTLKSLKNLKRWCFWTSLRTEEGELPVSSFSFLDQQRVIPFSASSHCDSNSLDVWVWSRTQLPQ